MHLPVVYSCGDESRERTETAVFDMITGNVQHTPRPHAGPAAVSLIAHAAILAAVVIPTLIIVTPPLPEMRTMMAFVAASPAPPPPPPAPIARPEPQAPKPVATSAIPAPVEAPREIVPESPPVDPGAQFVGGEEGGVPGGIPGGIVGGLAEALPLPPPPPPKPKAPIRIGGQVKEPALVHRVEPVYPSIAVARQLEGMVILEAIVDEEGRVESVRVLRSHKIFEDAAVEAVRQWRYSPVLLNGRPEKFILTVVVSFTLR